MSKKKVGFWGHDDDSDTSGYYDDYYDRLYGGSSKKKKTSYGGGYYGGYGGYGGGYGYGYGGGRSSWSWGSYGSDVFEEEDDLYIKSHPSYLTPTSTSISWKLEHKEDTAKNRTLIKEFARYFYYRMIDEKDYFEEKYKDPSKLSDEDKAILDAKVKMYDELWDKFIPGVSPLDKAVALYRELQSKQPDDKKEMTEEDMAKSISQVEFHEEIYKDPIFNELLDMQSLAKNNKMDILNKLSLIKNLGSQFKIEKDIEEKIAHNSRLISKKIMRDYSQIHQVDMYQRLMPHFKSKLLTKDLIINTPIDRTEHKQKIIILVDYSGSMSYPEKQKWVLAILIDRLRYVMKEEAEVFFSFFVNRTQDLRFHHLYNRETALKFWSQFSTSPNGGDTCLGEMINHINNEINVHKRLCNLKIDLSEEKPEVLAINDRI